MLSRIVGSWKRKKKIVQGSISKIMSTHSFLPVSSQNTLLTNYNYFLPWLILGRNKGNCQMVRDSLKESLGIWYSPQLTRQNYIWLMTTRIVTVLSARFACFYNVFRSHISLSGTVLWFCLFIFFIFIPFSPSTGILGVILELASLFIFLCTISTQKGTSTVLMLNVLWRMMKCFFSLSAQRCNFC